MATLTPTDRKRLQRFIRAYQIEWEWPALRNLDWRGASRLVWIRWLVRERGAYRDDLRAECSEPSPACCGLIERLLSPISEWLSADSLS